MKNLKKITVFLLASIWFQLYPEYSYSQDFVLHQETVEVKIDDFKEYGYGNNQGYDDLKDKSIQPISSKDDAVYFIDKVSEGIKEEDFKDVIDAYLSDFKKFGGLTGHTPVTKPTIVFVHHPLETEFLKDDEQANKKKAEGTYMELCKRKKSLELFLKELDEKFQATTVDMDGSGKYVQKIKSSKDATSLTSTDIDNYKSLLETRRTIYEEIELINKEMKVALADYKASRSQFKEKDKVEHIILHREDNNYSDYLLNSTRVLLVVLGGDDDLQDMKVTVDNKPNRLQKGFNELVNLSGAIGLTSKTGSFTSGGNRCDFDLLNGVKDKLKCTFILLDKKQIKPPAEITLSHDSIADIKLDIHEKSFAQFAIGVSGSFVERKQFMLNDDDELTISLDENDKEEWKGNAMVLVEFFPWGRDIDRMEPIWKKKTTPRGSKYYFQRFGITTGLRISKDPLETIFLGGSFALSRDISLTAGLSFQSTPIDVTDLPVGPEATLEYLQQNVGREYKPKFFFGVSFSPSGFAKTIGLKKNDE